MRERDARGRASWELGTKEGRPQKSSQPAKIPTIRRLLIQGGEVHVSDSIRKLELDGSLTASDIKLDARTSFPKPFDLARYSVKCEVSGNDLADVYHLTGLALPNTAPYRLSADVEHRGTLFRMDDLKGKLGSSDIEGMVEIETGRKRPKFTAKLRSDTLNMVDLAPTLGQPAAPANTLAPASTSSPPDTSPSQGAPAAPASPRAHATRAAQPNSLTPPVTPAVQRLFPDADLQVNRVRGMDADVNYQARSVMAPKMPIPNRPSTWASTMSTSASSRAQN
jgi:AsmA family protein